MRDVSYLGNGSRIIERQHGTAGLYGTLHSPSITITYSGGDGIYCLHLSGQDELADLRDKLSALLESCAAANAKAEGK